MAGNSKEKICEKSMYFPNQTQTIRFSGLGGFDKWKGIYLSRRKMKVRMGPQLTSGVIFGVGTSLSKRCFPSYMTSAGNNEGLWPKWQPIDGI